MIKKILLIVAILGFVTSSVVMIYSFSSSDFLLKLILSITLFIINFIINALSENKYLKLTLFFIAIILSSIIFYKHYEIDKQSPVYYGHLTPRTSKLPDSATHMASIILGNVNVQTSSVEFSTLSYCGTPFFKIKIDKSIMKVSTKVMDNSNNYILSIVDNEFKANMEHAFNPMQPDEHSLVVRDLEGSEVLNIEFVHPKKIRIAGRFYVARYSTPLLIDKDLGIILPEGGRIDSTQIKLGSNVTGFLNLEDESCKNVSTLSNPELCYAITCLTSNYYTEHEKSALNEILAGQYDLIVKEKIEAGDVDGAWKLLKESLTNNAYTAKEKALAAYALAILSDLKQNVQEAKNYYMKAAELDQYNSLYLIKLSNMSYILQDYQNALGYAQEALRYSDAKDTSLTSAAYNNTGLVYLKMRNLNEAIENFEKALDINLKASNNPIAIAESYKYIGIVLRHMGKYMEALNSYNYAVDTIKGYFKSDTHIMLATIYNDIGYALYKSGDIIKAIKYYEMALRIERDFYGDEMHPESAVLHFNMGLAYDKKGDYSNSIKSFEKNLEIQKSILNNEFHAEIAKSYYHISKPLYKSGEYQEAVANLRKSYEILSALNHPFAEKVGLELQTMNNDNLK